MKKTLFISLCLIAFSSCKSDDEETASIVGDWKISKIEVKYGNGSTESLTPNNCEAQTTMYFKNDGKGGSKVYYLDGNICKSDSFNGTYTYDPNSKKITLANQNPHL